MVLIAIEYRSR